MISKKYSDLNKAAQDLKDDYQSNLPFPNIYLDDFFDETTLREVLGEFPSIDKLQDKIHYTNPNENKFASKGEYRFGKQTKNLVHFLNSQPFLEFLQELTGIEETLIPDPYFEGGGYHEIKPDGFLKLHVDFHMHKKLNLSRRLNLLIYLNEDWEESYGGDFELWEKDMSQCVVKISPIFNRIAIFSTTGASWHGHPDPLTCPPNRSRKSIALYYYTNGRPAGELDSLSKNRITTTFKERKGIDDPKMKTYNSLVNFANKVLPKSAIKFLKEKRNK